MKIKNYTLNLNLLIIILISSSTLFSQISYTKSHYASGAYSLQMTTVTAGVPFFNFDTTGANMTWNYATLGKDINGFKSTVTPSGSGYQAAYLTQCALAGGGFGCLLKWNNLTDLGTVDLDSMNLVILSLYDVTTMMKTSNNRLVGTIKGLKIKDSTGITIPVIAEYYELDTILNFPLNYLDSNKSNGAWGLDLNSIGQNITYKSSYKRNYKVEGWGTLITPFRTYPNVLKVKTKLNQVDSINFMGTAFGIPSTVIEYTWYDLNYKLPIMKAEGIEVLGNVTINSVLYHDTVRYFFGINEIKDLSSQFSIYPNPAINTLNVNYSKDISVTGYRIVDITGKLISNNKISKKISINNLKKGSYFIQFVYNNQLIGVKKFVVID